jgi:transposase-like protein
VKRKRYSRKFQRMAVERMRSRGNIGDLAKELGVTRRCLYKWQAKLDHLEPGEAAPRTNSHESTYRQQVHRLKRLLAEKTLEVEGKRHVASKRRALPSWFGSPTSAAQQIPTAVQYGSPRGPTPPDFSPIYRTTDASSKSRRGLRGWSLLGSP